jgi:hypothetical protein
LSTACFGRLLDLVLTTFDGQTLMGWFLGTFGPMANSSLSSLDPLL